MPKLINSDQNGFLDKRRISDNLRLIYDLIDYCDFFRIPASILSLDIEKAFDSLTHEFLFMALQKAGFPDTFISYIKTLYKTASSCVCNYGHMSKRFLICRGVRQGDPLSPSLFVLAIEFLAEFIRSNPQIHGIKTKTKEYKISLLADDSLIFISNHLQFDRLFDTLKHFGKLSGCNLNISKSNAFHVGPARHCATKFYADSGLQWPSDYITYLGIKIPTSKFSLEQSFNLNLTPKLTSIKIICNIWGKYNLTFFGKITIIKSLIFSRLLYPLTCTPCIPPKRFIKDLNLILFKFIWEGKWERAKRDTLICPIEEGGIGMIHLESYIAATQLQWTRDLLPENLNLTGIILNTKCSGNRELIFISVVTSV